ncbi:MAG TPA: GNAT family N-acetyltransferase [Azospirillaceae bacterium]|nr:GNAT family N-acetyltransferase [Azospirillaceae bacterium]
MIRLLEDFCLSAWPSLRTIHDDGWVLRFAGGHTGRANAVTCLAAGEGPMAPRVDHAEAAYRREGLRPMFRITPLAPPELEPELDRRGYDLFQPTLVQEAALAPGPGPEGTRIDPSPSEDWIAAYVAMTGVPGAEHAAMRGILAAISPPALYAAALDEAGGIAAVALGVVDRGWVGLFKVAARPELRGRGHAGRAVGAVLARAGEMGARNAYLQVAAANAPALALYRRFGFRDAYPYHYRRAPE